MPGKVTKSSLYTGHVCLLTRVYVFCYPPGEGKNLIPFFRRATSLNLKDVGHPIQCEVLVVPYGITEMIKALMFTNDPYVNRVST